MYYDDYSQSKTKLPQVTHALLPRKNIASIIDNASLDEAIFLIAPYGYGKTLAVMSWLLSHNQKGAWLILDEEDNTKASFFTGLAIAMLQLAGQDGVIDDTLSRLQYSESPEDFFREVILLAEQNESERILVIDGLWMIHDQGVLLSFKNIVSGMLERWRVIIISRTEMPVVFNELMLRRRVRLITIKELAFSPDEIEEFFCVNGFQACRQDVLEISMETEGWPAALNVILTLSEGGPITYSESVRECVNAFFEMEIWNGLPENKKEFLLKTSVLEKLTPAACNAVTDIGATLPTLRWLFVNGMFIAKLNERESFRYHRIFQRFLLDKLGTSGIDKSELYKKIGWRLFERDDFEQAFVYFFKAVDLYGLSRVLRNINSAELELEQYLELTSCIRSLEIESLRDHPLIAARMALIHFALGNITEMQRIYNILVEWINSDTLSLPQEEYEECVWEVGWLSYLNPFEPIVKNQKHNDWVRHSEISPEQRAMSNVRTAVYRFPSILRGVRDYCPALGSIDQFVLENYMTGNNVISDGSALWQIEIIQAEYAYELENFTLAEQMVRNIITKVEGQEFADLYFVCTALLVKITRALRGSNGISALTSRLEKVIIKSGYKFLLPRYHAFELRNQLVDGHIGQTETFKAENKDYMDKPYFYLLYRHITLVRAFLSTGDFHEATMLLGNLERLCHQYNRIMDLIEVNILQSVADFGLGHNEDARSNLEKAIDSAREYGFIRIFSDDAKMIWPILEGIDSDTNDAYVKSIVISCKKMFSRSGFKPLAKDREHIGLTKTELKILKILHTNLSYEEIGIDNNIKMSTVKSHIHSIYSKLDVSDRISAVMMARSLKLID